MKMKILLFVVLLLHTVSVSEALIDPPREGKYDCQRKTVIYSLPPAVRPVASSVNISSDGNFVSFPGTFELTGTGEKISSGKLFQLSPSVQKLSGDPHGVVVMSTNPLSYYYSNSTEGHIKHVSGTGQLTDVVLLPKRSVCAVVTGPGEGCPTFKEVPMVVDNMFYAHGCLYVLYASNQRKLDRICGLTGTGTPAIEPASSSVATELYINGDFVLYKKYVQTWVFCNSLDSCLTTQTELTVSKDNALPPADILDFKSVAISETGILITADTSETVCVTYKGSGTLSTLLYMDIENQLPCIQVPSVIRVYISKQGNVLFILTSTEIFIYQRKDNGFVLQEAPTINSNFINTGLIHDGLELSYFEENAKIVGALYDSTAGIKTFECAIRNQGNIYISLIVFICLLYITIVTSTTTTTTHFFKPYHLLFIHLHIPRLYLIMLWSLRGCFLLFLQDNLHHLMFTNAPVFILFYIQKKMMKLSFLILLSGLVMFSRASQVACTENEILNGDASLLYTGQLDISWEGKHIYFSHENPADAQAFMYSDTDNILTDQFIAQNDQGEGSGIFHSPTGDTFIAKHGTSGPYVSVSPGNVDITVGNNNPSEYIKNIHYYKDAFDVEMLYVFAGSTVYFTKKTSGNWASPVPLYINVIIMHAKGVRLIYSTSTSVNWCVVSKDNNFCRDLTTVNPSITTVTGGNINTITDLKISASGNFLITFDNDRTCALEYLPTQNFPGGRSGLTKMSLDGSANGNPSFNYIDGCAYSSNPFYSSISAQGGVVIIGDKAVPGGSVGNLFFWTLRDSAAKYKYVKHYTHSATIAPVFVFTELEDSLYGAMFIKESRFSVLTCDVTCGNGITDLGERCDDGNNIGKDGCSDACTIEPNFFCTTASPSGCSVKIKVTTSSPTCPDILVQSRIVLEIFQKMNAAIRKADIFNVDCSDAQSRLRILSIGATITGQAKTVPGTEYDLDTLNTDNVEGAAGMEIIPNPAAAGRFCFFILSCFHYLFFSTTTTLFLNLTISREYFFEQIQVFVQILLLLFCEYIDIFLFFKKKKRLYRTGSIF